MGLIRDESLILADTTFFCRFAEGMMSPIPVEYLGSRLAVTTEVVGELEYRSQSGMHNGLKSIEGRDPPWCDGPAVVLTDAERKRANDLARGWRALAERRTGQKRHERADIGEASTIVAALAGAHAVILDEGKAKAYAKGKGLRVFTTQDVVVEMVAADKLKPAPAFLVYKHVYASSTREQFDASVAAARKAMVG